MPIYEYECEKCHHLFEELQPFTDKIIKECPQCGDRANRLISQGAGLIFKGTGFYITDYARKKTPEPSETKKSDSSKEKKSDSDTTSKSKENKTASKDE